MFLDLNLKGVLGTVLVGEAYRVEWVEAPPRQKEFVERTCTFAAAVSMPLHLVKEFRGPQLRAVNDARPGD